MTREQKINVLKAVKAGIPVKRALVLCKLMQIAYKDGDNYYIDGEIFKQQEIDWYNNVNELPMIIFEDASGQFDRSVLETH